MRDIGRLYVRFKAVDYIAHVFLNGCYLGSHEGFFAPFELDFTTCARVGTNTLVVKVENEGFNTLKNQGYHLEHNFGHGEQYLSESFFLLNLLAYFVHQILELVDEWYQKARSGFSARVEFWNAVRAILRFLLFESWDQVLERINGPALPAFPAP